MFGVHSFDWLFTGFIKLHWIQGFIGERLENVGQYRQLSGAAAVPTALHPFYVDFGLIGMGLPMCFYMSIWLYFFYRSRTSYSMGVYYFLYSAGFALTAFQSCRNLEKKLFEKICRFEKMKDFIACIHCCCPCTNRPRLLQNYT